MRLWHDNRENDEVVEFRVAHQYYEIHVVVENCILRSLDCLQPRGMMVTFGQTSGAIDPIAPVLLSQKGFGFSDAPSSLPLHRATRCAPEASASELLEVVASGKVRINVNQRFALKDAADAHKAWKRAQPRAPPS